MTDEEIAAQAVKDAAAAKLAAETAAAAAEAAAKIEADRLANDKNKTSDAEAKLLKENMAKKKQVLELEEKLKLYEGIDVTVVKKLMSDKVEADKAEAEKKGDFDRLKKMMADEHAAEVTKLKTAEVEKDKAFKIKEKQIADLTIGQSFSNSTFIKNELTMTAGIVFGDYFETEGDVVVAFDKPKSEANRTKMVDGSGEPLDFEVAIKRLIDADEDKDTLLKSKLASGAGSKTDPTGTSKAKPGVGTLTGVELMTAILNKGNGFKKK